MSETKCSESELDRLVRAVFSAGFRAGFQYGQDHAVAYDWGSRSSEPDTPEKAWEQDVQWMIDTDTDMHLDINNPKHWENVP